MNGGHDAYVELLKIVDVSEKTAEWANMSRDLVRRWYEWGERYSTDVQEECLEEPGKCEEIAIEVQSSPAGGRIGNTHE